MDAWSPRQAWRRVCIGRTCPFGHKLGAIFWWTILVASQRQWNRASTALWGLWTWRDSCKGPSPRVGFSHTEHPSPHIRHGTGTSPSPLQLPCPRFSISSIAEQMKENVHGLDGVRTSSWRTCWQMRWALWRWYWFCSLRFFGYRLVRPTFVGVPYVRLFMAFELGEQVWRRHLLQSPKWMLEVLAKRGGEYVLVVPVPLDTSWERYFGGQYGALRSNGPERTRAYQAMVNLRDMGVSNNRGTLKWMDL